MQPTMEILEKIYQNSNKKKNEVFTRLYRYLLRPDLYYVAYKKLYSNNGASTKGVDDDTADGFSEEKVLKIIERLASETYMPSPVRRTYIEKRNGKMRPLGIPTFTDKLVQEVLRMVLEAVYEPIFLNTSHGFRPQRSCHTALKEIKQSFCGTRWFVEGDIKGCFDNINHNTLVGFISEKIKDARLIKLIYKFLKAGYLEDWKYNNTYSGTPQGGIISPILANIYLHELDKYIEKLKTEFDKKAERNRTPEYSSLQWKLSEMRKKLKTSTEADKQLLLSSIKETKSELLKTPSKSQTDKKLKYIRYADDFLIGVNGDKQDCEWIKSTLSDYIRNTLKMELSEEKTLITHSDTPARFLGYDVKVRRNEKIKPAKNGFTKRTLHNKVELNVPLKDKIEKFLFNNRAIVQKNGAFEPCSRGSLTRLTDLEIVSAYNSELRGICNYYHLASNFKQLNYFAYLMEYSCLKTLAHKHKSSTAKIIDKFRDKKGGWCIPYATKDKEKQLYFARYQDSLKSKISDDVIQNRALQHFHTTTSFESRLKVKVCELCGTTESEHYEIHHINKVKNLKGKERWEQAMIAKRRKTIVVCRKCHKDIHK